MSDDEPLPAEHPRTAIVEMARRSIAAHLRGIKDTCELTATEYLGILVGEMQLTLRGCLRRERHPYDSSKPADEA